ncbi:ferritin-like domain-containing protein [Roseomonas sp. GC11]|uniref:DUF892 family protein n=1 Tax=Roseomonas sp. GC11 TaxID=2950546 RepID=UPI00210CA59A|nr:ferritin-like domain-containing protein [Roseomonas sp. GC11]MCQ4158344.1 ferritin-like domain-containing protein [Roseomonas sp. GC11]
MVTTVGTETTFPRLVRNLLLLEHDAIAAYEQAIARLDNPAFKQQIAAFRSDHDRHVQELTRIADSLGTEAPLEGDAKKLLTTGKVALASLLGDSATLMAMRSNEEDTITAYERACQHSTVPAEARRLFEQALQDERRHHAWMDQTAKAA